MFGLYRFSIYTVGVGWLFICNSGFLVVTFHQINVQLPRFLYVYWLPRGSWGLKSWFLCRKILKRILLYF